MFVTHDVGLYGASRSLQTLLSNLEDTDIDLAVKKRFFRSRDLDAVKAFYGDRVQHVREFYFPLPDCYQGSESNSFVVGLNQVFWQSNAQAFYDFIRKNEYDYVHLNSLVLYQLIRPGLPFFIHIREILKGNERAVAEGLQKAIGVIFIDDTTAAPFRGLSSGNTITLNNPFDMRPLKYLEISDIREKYNLDNKTVFAIIGSVSEVKGVDLAIKAFREVRHPDALLLIVGKGQNKAYLSRCHELAQADPRIVFYGEEAEIGKIYAVSDYILRCDPQFCIGRTVYEGLYAGCNVIMPGEDSDKSEIYDFENFAENIMLYPPLHCERLTETIEACATQKVIHRQFSTNIGAHLAQFNQFITARLASRQGHKKLNI